MFKCSECGCEYKEKPDFCDCGNDTFDLINEESVKTSDKKDFRLKIEPKNLLSWIIFGVLLFVSVLILIFFPKINVSNQVQQSDEIKKEQNDDIPNLNSFWIDCKPQVVQEQVKEQIQNIIVKPAQKEISNKNTNIKSQQKTVVKTVQQTQKPQQVKKQQQPVVKQNPQTTKPKSGKSIPQTMTYEVVNYRIALRQRLFSNLDIYTIQGSGTCGVEFAIDETGKLINRGFTFQSDNKTVNDAVYKMLMRTPKFNPPPESFVNKKVKLILKLDNESYEIKYVD